MRVALHPEASGGEEPTVLRGPTCSSSSSPTPPSITAAAAWWRSCVEELPRQMSNASCCSGAHPSEARQAASASEARCASPLAPRCTTSCSAA
jgi:hypothetical protein